MSAAIATRLGMSNRFAAYLGTLIRQHLRLGFLVREQPLTRRALARYRRDAFGEGPKRERSMGLCAGSLQPNRCNPGKRRSNR